MNFKKLLNFKKLSEFLLGLGLGIIVFGAIWVALEFRNAPSPPGLPLSIGTKAATVLSQPMGVPTFTLTDHKGNPFTEKDLQGHWSFIFFGYTHCPDICPTALTLLNQVDLLLQEKPISVHPRFIFISIDPQRDTPERLAQYVTYFNPSFLGVSGLEEQLKRLTNPLGIAYQRSFTDASSNQNYLVDHSASILLIDPQAQLRALLNKLIKSRIVQQIIKKF